MLQTITFDALVNAIKNTHFSDEMKRDSQWYELVNYFNDNTDMLRQLYDSSVDKMIDHLMDEEGFGIGMGWIWDALQELEEDMQ